MRYFTWKLELASNILWPIVFVRPRLEITVNIEVYRELLTHFKEYRSFIMIISVLTHFMPLVFPLFPENSEKPVAFLCFQRVYKGISGMKWVTNYFMTVWSKDYWVKVFKNGPSKICGRQSLKNFEVIWSA